MKKRRILILASLALVILPIATLSIAEYVACSRNRSVEKAWDDWVGHRTGPPPWEAPSHDLERFADESLSATTKSGWTTNLVGYRDADGNTVISPRFTSCAQHFYNGLAWARDASGKSGYISPEGEWQIVVPGQVSGDFIGGVGKFWVRGQYDEPTYGLVDRSGTVIVSPKYYWIDYPHNGYVLVRELTGLGYRARHLARKFGAFPESCLYARAYILDTSGNVVDGPLSSSHP